MQHLKNTLWLLLLILIAFSCQTDDRETLPEIKARSSRMVNADDIPLVMTSLSEDLHFRTGTTHSANTGQVHTAVGKIDLEQIFEVVDTLSNASYTFLVDDEDNDLFTFTNLIVKKREDGAIDPPYLLEYTVDSLYRDAFLESGLSMDQFTGVISKRFLTNFSTQQQSSANLGGEYDAQTGEPCDYDTRATGGGGVVGITDPLPPADGNYTGSSFIRCEFLTIAEEVTTCYRSDVGDGPRCRISTRYITKTHCYWVGPSQDVYDGNNCPDPETGEVGVLTADAKLLNAMRISREIRSNPAAILSIPCSELEKWEKVALHTPSTEIVEKIAQINREHPFAIGLFKDDFRIQNIANAEGGTLNMDYFSVTATELPRGMTADGFLRYMRLNLNDFVDTNLSSFHPYDLVETGTDEAALWRANDPTGAIVHINIPVDDGSVICSDFSNKHWRFSTISAPYDWFHPVSGTREFGYERQTDGSYIFYTRGVDRLTTAFSEFYTASTEGTYQLGERVMRDLSFAGADGLWKSLQKGITTYINNNGGFAYKNDPLIYRPDYVLVEKIINGELPMTSLGCD